MNKLNSYKGKFAFTFFLFTFLTLSAASVYAATGESEEDQLLNNRCKQKEEYKVWDERKGVPGDKSWTIKFNTSLDAYAVDRNNVYVLNENSEKIDLRLQTLSPSEIIIAPPLNGYSSGNYTLYIGGNSPIYAENGNCLKQPVTMDFTVEKSESYIGIDGYTSIIHSAESRLGSYVDLSAPQGSQLPEQSLLRAQTNDVLTDNYFDSVVIPSYENPWGYYAEPGFVFPFMLGKTYEEAFFTERPNRATVYTKTLDYGDEFCMNKYTLVVEEDKWKIDEMEIISSPSNLETRVRYALQQDLGVGYQVEYSGTEDFKEYVKEDRVLVEIYNEGSYFETYFIDKETLDIYDHSSGEKKYKYDAEAGNYRKVR